MNLKNNLKAFSLTSALALVSGLEAKAQLVSAPIIISPFVYLTGKPESNNLIPGREYSINFELDLSRIPSNNEVDKINWYVVASDELGAKIESGLTFTRAYRPSAQNDIFLGRESVNQRIDISGQEQTLDFGVLNYPLGIGPSDSQNHIFATYKFTVDESLAGKSIDIYPAFVYAYDLNSNSSILYSSSSSSELMQVAVPEPIETSIIFGLTALAGAYALKRKNKIKGVD